MSLRKFIRSIEDKGSNLQPLENIALFESSADYTDNTKAVFDEMVRRGLNENIKFVWVCKEEKNVERLKEKFKDIKNTDVVYRYTRRYKYYYSKKAKFLICCNTFLEKSKKKQYYIYLAHGGAMKNTVGKYEIPSYCSDADIVTISDYLRKYDALNLNCSEKQFLIFGFPRTDVLFKKRDLNELFPAYSFEKLIYWMPTYRQTTGGEVIHSDVSMPIIHSLKDAEQINECAKGNNVLLLIKLHQIQDSNKITPYNLSNILFINEDYLYENEIDNYEILGNSSALISDYSSVYYDYLLCDRPIGLCWDDFEEYKKREGFTVDPEYVMSGGEKIYNADDFCAFVSRVANGEDVLKKQREGIRDVVHKYRDGKATKRVVDYLEKQLAERL